MLTIICGEDVVAARSHFVDLKKQTVKKGYTIQEIAAKDLPNILLDQNTISLFGQKNCYFTQNLNAQIGRSKKDAFLEALKRLSESTDIEIFDWEGGKEQRELKIKTLGTVKEFKASQSIFQLLDQCYPGNANPFIKALHKVIETQEEGFVYAMLCRHTRSLMLAAENALPSSVQVWQKGKLSSQARQWPKEKLIKFYEGLAKIDVSTKTSNNVFGIGGSIELLACYFL